MDEWMVGINFSDDLARCVAVVGMPYPDTRDPVLQEKIRYASLRDDDDTPAATVSSHSHRGGGGVTNSQRFCEALCMKAVNQSIGRSIRHIHDYSAIVLLDHRYGAERIQALLPQWIRNSMWTVMRDDCYNSSSSSSSGALSLADNLSGRLKAFYAAQTKKAFR